MGGRGRLLGLDVSGCCNTDSKLTGEGLYSEVDVEGVLGGVEGVIGG